MPATELTAGDNGGLCAGTGRRADAEDILYITLAGFVWEGGCGIFGKPILAKCSGADFDEAKEILNRFPRLRFAVSRRTHRIRMISVNAALLRCFKDAGELLMPHFSLIEDLGRLLEDRQRLSARTVAAILREYRKRRANEDREAARQQGIGTNDTATARGDGADVDQIGR